MWKHLKAVTLLPIMVMVVVPAIILHSTGLSGTALQRPTPWNMLMLVGAAVFLIVGLVLFVTTGDPVRKDWSRDIGTVEPSATPGCGRPVPLCP